MDYQHLQPSADVAKKSGRVAVLMGGTVSEREVSLKSGSMVLKSLQQAGVDAFAVDIGDDPIAQLSQMKADRVFSLLHGRIGEDGQIQAILESLKLPYVGSGIKASAVTMDKLMTKRVLKGCGLATPAFQQIETLDQCTEAMEALGLPLVIKPVYEGSSIGVTKVENKEQLAHAYQTARPYGPMMAEQWIVGEEYTVAWLGGTVLPAIRLGTDHAFYDYDAKYVANDTQYICPCGLETEELEKLNALVADSVKACDLKHWCRVDVMRDQQGTFQVIEINTIPGMTDHSLVPMAARQAGLDFQQLVLKLLEYSLETEVHHA